jgi:membrane protein implicated in regulation of membrane protease activity
VKKFELNIRAALIFTPAIFILAFWIMALSSSSLLASIGLQKMILWALVLSIGTAYSITLFINEILKQRDSE